MSATAEQLSQYMENYGWVFQQTTSSSWQTGWQSDKRAYPLNVELNDTWIRFEVKPLVRFDVDWDAHPEIMRFILNLNNECHLVRASLSEEGELSVILEVFNRKFGYDEFSEAIGVLGYYAELLYEQVIDCIMELGIHLGYQNRFLA